MTCRGQPLPSLLSQFGLRSWDCTVSLGLTFLSPQEIKSDCLAVQGRQNGPMTFKRLSERRCQTHMVCIGEICGPFPKIWHISSMFRCSGTSNHLMAKPYKLLFWAHPPSHFPPELLPKTAPCVEGPGISGSSMASSLCKSTLPSQTLVTGLGDERSTPCFPVMARHVDRDDKTKQSEVLCHPWAFQQVLDLDNISLAPEPQLSPFTSPMGLPAGT